jgi:Uncharacterized protein conserved in bacteria
MTLTCPKCASEMRSYERNRVLVDQCTGCGGLFLDRGELEKLVAAENEWHAPPAPSPVPQAQPYYRESAGYDQRQGEGYYQPHRRKKKSFLSELFDD